MRRVFLLLLLGGCKYISNPAVDPADPNVFSIYNASNNTAYLRLSDNGSALGSALTITDTGGNAIKTVVGCEGLCSDGCFVTNCTNPPSVRSLAPGEAILVDWNLVVFEDGSETCSGVERACSVGQRVAEGRYDVKLCYSGSIHPADATVPSDRNSIDPERIDNATTDAETCLTALNFSVPGYDVHWGLTIE